MGYQHRDCIIKKRTIDGQTRNIQCTTCKYCEDELQFTCISGIMPSTALKKKLAQKKWRYNEDGGHTCNACLIKFKSRAKRKAAAKSCETKKPPAPNTQLKEQLKEALEMTEKMELDATTNRALMMALMQHVDQATGVYKEDMNDERIAKSLKVKTDIVEKQRFDLYGDLYEKAKKDGALKLIKDMKQSKEEFKKFSDAVMKTLGQYEQKLGELEAEINRLQ